MERLQLEKKLFQLREMVAEYVPEGIAVAFSGGVDSSLLLKVACEEGKKQGRQVHAVLFDTFLHPSGDRTEAEKVAAECGAVFHVLEVDEMDNPLILDNPKERCYHCKKFIFGKLAAYAEKNQLHILLEGTNGDDIHVYRPGFKAVKAIGAISPLADLNLSKAEVRKMADMLGVSTASKPSAACLATRLPYGTRLDKELLHRIEQAEDVLKTEGFDMVRVRVHGEIARIELSRDRFGVFMDRADRVTDRLKKLGLKYITLDLEGFRSGSMDE